MSVAQRNAWVCSDSQQCSTDDYVTAAINTITDTEFCVRTQIEAAINLRTQNVKFDKNVISRHVQP